MKISKIYLPLILLVAIGGCTEQDMVSTDDPLILSQEIYFEVAHSNQAWASMHEGFIVDNAGAVRTYKNPTAWNEATNTKGLLTSTQIKENISKTVATDLKVDVTELKALVGKIPKISTTDFTKRIAGGNDMGQTNFYAYQYDTKKEAYVPILLSETGDWQSQNKDKSAIEISEWLETIQAKLK